MGISNNAMSNRRRFLRYLAASPLFNSTGWPSGRYPGGGAAWAADAAINADIASAAQALNVFDLERVAMKSLPVAHGAYLATGVESDATIRANREGFSKFQVRARRLVDTTRLDTKVELFGTTWPTPIVIDPVSSLRAFHPEGDVAVARAARARNHLQIYPTLATSALDDVIKAREAPVWFQLYPTMDRNITKALVKRAEAAGCPVVAVTVDNPTSAGRETLARGRRMDSRNCLECHASAPGAYYQRKPMFDGLEVTRLTSPLADNLAWDFVRWLKDTTSMKVVLKGIVTAEDAALSLRHGADGILVSNHGGRGEESMRSTIEALPEVVDAIGGKIPVLVDSGFRRGSDVFKALALGASAVCIGRPYVWGLAAFGQSGVERALEILKTELEITMRSMGAPSVRELKRGFIQRV
jgi:isopentenyl diphosphate isomerase/L-lactate dehydrogenase-like FMN-dependent dehydrogenase